MRRFLLITFCMLLLPGILLSQEVIVSGFPIGVGRSIENDFFTPYHDALQQIADTLKKYPLAEAIITGGADGEVYRTDDNTKNPALAVGRAHALRNYMTTQFNLNPVQIAINSEEVTMKSPKGRYASVRISQESIDLAMLVARLRALEANTSFGDMLARLEALENQPPVEKHFTQMVPDTTKAFSDKFGIIVSTGLSTSPFGGMPVVAGGVTWERNLFIEVIGGHTLWTTKFDFNDLTLKTQKRLLGGQISYYPFENKNFGLLAGWMRVEEIADEYYEFVKLSEGPMFGARLNLARSLSITASYNPAKHREISNEFSSNKDGQFLFSLTFFEIFGGGQ